MDEDQYIEEALKSFETLSEYTERMIEAILGWFQTGTTLEWFLDNWPEIVKKDKDLSPSEEAAIGPWIQTWAEEAFRRMESKQ